MDAIERVEDAGGSDGVPPLFVAGVELHVAEERLVRIGIVGNGEWKGTALGEGIFERRIDGPGIAAIVRSIDMLRAEDIDEVGAIGVDEPPAGIVETVPGAPVAGTSCCQVGPKLARGRGARGVATGRTSFHNRMVPFGSPT